MSPHGEPDAGDVSEWRRFAEMLGPPMGGADRVVARLGWDAGNRLVRFRICQEASSGEGGGFLRVLEIRFDGDRPVVQRFNRSGEPAGDAEEWVDLDPDTVPDSVRALFEQCAQKLVLEWQKNKERWQ